MNTTRKWVDGEDLGDAVLFTALAAIVLMSLEFLFTATFVRYISVPILIVEAAAATAAGALISIVTVKATDDDRSSRVFFLTPGSASPRARGPARRVVILAQVLPARPF
jgi:hypothetical protein